MNAEPFEYAVLLLQVKRSTNYQEYPIQENETINLNDWSNFDFDQQQNNDDDTRIR